MTRQINYYENEVDGVKLREKKNKRKKRERNRKIHESGQSWLAYIN